MLSQLSDKVKERKADLYIAAVIFLVGLASFGLGRLSAAFPRKEPIQIMVPEAPSANYEPEARDQSQSSQSPTKTASMKNAVISNVGGKYVASKSGKYYYAPWCSGALRIKEQNRVWFDTKEAAEKKGYKPAAGCQGL